MQMRPLGTQSLVRERIQPADKKLKRFHAQLITRCFRFTDDFRRSNTFETCRFRHWRLEKIKKKKRKYLGLELLSRELDPVYGTSKSGSFRENSLVAAIGVPGRLRKLDRSEKIRRDAGVGRTRASHEC